MKFFFADNKRPYVINQPELIQTPRLIVFKDRIHDNISRMSDLLQAADPNVTLSDLCPHVKTQKSVLVTRLLLEKGVSFFKASINEVDLLVQSGAPFIFVAYPLLELDARKIAGLKKQHPDIRFYVQAARREHVEILENIARETGIIWHYYIDTNVGMNRTGLPVEDAFAFFESIHSPFLQFAGLHAYDGHIHDNDFEARKRESFQSMERLKKSVNHFTARGVRVPCVIVAGTPSFVPDVEYWSQNSVDSKILFSPGTWIYFDTKTNEMMPNTFDYAAVILSQVVDKPTSETATLNLGHKRWAIDQGPIDTFSLKGISAESWSEEHTVVRLAPETQLDIKDYVLFAPRHVCSTVNLWDYFVLIDESGDIVDETCPVDGRNR